MPSSQAPIGIITGAATGIGEATAVEFAGLGSRLVLVGLPTDDLDAVVAKVRAAGGEGVAAPADVRDAEQVSRFCKLATERFGQIDFLFANAGIADQSTVAGGNPVKWKAIIETNLLGAMYCARAVLADMLRRRSGHIILTASGSGRSTYVGEPAYIASKWGLVGFGHALRKEVAPQGVRVTLLEPGLVDTPLTRSVPMFKPLFEGSEPLQPEDVARVVVFAHLQPNHVDISEVAVNPVRVANTEWFSPES